MTNLEKWNKEHETNFKTAAEICKEIACDRCKFHDLDDCDVALELWAYEQAVDKSMSAKLGISAEQLNKGIANMAKAFSDIGKNIRELCEMEQEIKIGDKIRMINNRGCYSKHIDIFELNGKEKLLEKHIFVKGDHVPLDIELEVIDILNHGYFDLNVYVLIDWTTNQIYLDQLENSNYFEIISDGIKQETKDKIQERLEHLKNKPKNLMPEIVKLLGVKPWERFSIIDDCDELLSKNVCFAENGDFLFSADTLHGLLVGEYQIVKQPPLTKDEAYKKIIKIIADFNDGWKPDFTNEKQGKLFYFWDGENIRLLNCAIYQYLPHELYLKAEPPKEILEQLKPFYKIYLDIK